MSQGWSSGSGKKRAGDGVTDLPDGRLLSAGRVCGTGLGLETLEWADTVPALMELTVQREDTLNSCDHVTDNSQHLLNAISVMIIFGCGLRRLKDWLKRHESTFSPPTAVWGLAVQGWLWQPFCTKFSDPDSFYLWHCTVTPTHSPDGCSGSATSAPEGIVLEAFPTW